MALDKRWFFDERGINDETLDAFGVVVEDGVAKFPFPEGAKLRSHADDGTRRFWSEGKLAGLFTTAVPSDADTAFLVEGETDAMRLYQESSGKYEVFGLSGLNWWKEEYGSYFDRFDTVYVILDNDEDYKVVSVADETWRGIRRTLGTKARRLTLPSGPIHAKDLCVFFDHYDLEFLYRLMADAEFPTVEEFQFSALDLSKPPPPTDWLVDGMIAKGDVAMFIGEPSIGKSWLTMDLAVAVATDGETWLGQDLNLPSDARVLYIDEENPEDVIRGRLAKLGLTPESASRIRYLSHQGVKLDRYPERILDEVYAFGPSVIIMDSFTRFHSQDENSAGAMSQVINDGIMPLSRDAGATVFVLHHTIKSDGGSSFARSRGSGDLTASPDAAWDCRGNSTRMFISNFKTRRQLSRYTYTAAVLDTRNGVEVRARPGATV
jgi:hypothetical protein